MASSRWAGQLLTWASTVLVARMLSPADYGLVTMASVFLAAVGMLSEFGIGSAVLTMRDLDESQLAQLHGLAIALGVIGVALSLAAAVPLGWFFRSAELPAVVATLGLPYLIGALQVVPSSLLRRELQFRTLSLIELGRGLCAAAVSLAAAFGGMRYWSLVLGTVAGSLLATALIIRARPAAAAWPRARGLRKVLGFSRDVLVARLAWIAYQEGDFAVAGRRLGAGAAGSYGLAWTVARSPIEKLGSVVGDVAPSLFSAVKGDRPSLRRYFCRLTEMLALVALPVAVGLACVSRDLVHVLFGERWREAALPLALIALYGGIQAVTTLFSPLLTIMGEQQFLMRRTLLAAAVMVPGFVVGSHWGPAGIAAAWLVLHPTLTASAYSGVRRVLDLPAGAYVGLYRLGLDGSVAMAALLLLFRWRLAATWPPPWRLAASIVLGAATFALVTLAVHGARLRAIVAWYRRVRGSPATGSA